jgi:PAS domain S-box-containing protein
MSKESNRKTPPSRKSAARRARTTTAAPAQQPLDESARILFETMSQGVIFRDMSGVIIAMNPSAERILKVRREQLLGRNSLTLPWMLIREDGSSLAPEELPADQVLTSGEPVKDFVLGLIDPADRSCTWLNVNAVPVFRPSEKRPYRAYILFEDITERRRATEALRQAKDHLEQEVKERVQQLSGAAEELAAQVSVRQQTEDALSESEEKFRRLAENAADFIYLYRIWPDRRFEYVSPSCTLMTGYTPEEYYASPYLGLQLVHADDRKKLRELASGARDFTAPLVLRVVRKDGRIIWTEQRSIPIYDRTGRLVALQGIARDITEHIRTEERLQENEKFLQTIIDTEPECVKMLGADGALLMMNRSGLEMIQADSLEQVRNKEVLPLVAPDYRRGFTSKLASVFQGNSVSFTFALTGLKGRRLWMDTHMVPLRDDKNRIIAALGITRDVTERKVIEDRLRQSEASLREAQRLAHLGSWDRDPRTQEVHWSLETYRILGYEPGTDIPSFDKFRSAIHHQDRALVFRALEDALQRKRPYDVEFRIIRPDGSVRIVHSRAELVADETGAPVKLYGTIQDLTERRRAEELLPRIAAHVSEKTGEEYFRSLTEFIIGELGTDYAFVAERIPDAGKMQTVAFNAQGKFVDNIAYDIKNTPCETVMGKTVCFYPERMQALFPGDATMATMNIESYAGIPLFDSTGKPRGAIVTMGCRPMKKDDKERIISLLRIFAGRASAELERRQSLAALQQSEQRYRQLLESVTSYLYTVTIENGKSVSTVHGPGCTAVTGYTPEDFGADPDLWYHMVYDDDKPVVLDQAERARQGIHTGPLEHRIRHKNGTVRWVRSIIVPRLDDQRKLVSYDGLITDITERRRSEEFVRSILESVDEGFIVVDREYRILTANRAFCAFFGLGAGEVVGKKCYEVSHRSIIPCSERGEPCAVRHALDTGRPATEVHTHLDASGSPLTVEIKAFPLRDETGSVVSAIEIITDITDKRRLEDQLRHAQKMEAMGLLAGGIAHDFNNILTAIVGYGNLLKIKTASGDPNLPYIDQVLASAARAAGLTRSLLAFSRKQVINPQPLDINKAILRIESILSRTVGEQVSLHVETAPAELTIIADSSQIEQVLMNIAMNARDAMPRGGTLTIRTDTSFIGEEFRKVHGFGIEGSYAVVSIADTGVGMRPEVKDRVFEPYFTTKEFGKGTGLGLSIVYGIMKQNNGYITVESEPGTGSVFRLYFPLIAAIVDQCSPEAPPLPTGHETILIAEDDESIRALTRTILSEFGYAVIEAVDGEDAIIKFREHCDAVRLVILDVVMPRKNGREVWEEIVRIRSDAKVLYFSSYSTDILRSKGFSEGIENLIQKPVSPLDLLRSVRKALDRPATSRAAPAE